MVCCCGGCSADADEVASVGFTAAGSCVVEVDIDVDVAAVRARERVHRLPLTVVMEPGGEAI